MGTTEEIRDNSIMIQVMTQNVLSVILSQKLLKKDGIWHSELEWTNYILQQTENHSGYF